MEVGVPVTSLQQMMLNHQFQQVSLGSLARLLQETRPITTPFHASLTLTALNSWSLILL